MGVDVDIVLSFFFPSTLNGSSKYYSGFNDGHIVGINSPGAIQWLFIDKNICTIGGVIIIYKLFGGLTGPVALDPDSHPGLTQNLDLIAEGMKSPL